MDLQDMEALLNQSRAELQEQRKRALEAELRLREFSGRLQVVRDELAGVRSTLISLEEENTRLNRKVNKACMVLKTGNSPERVLAELAAILLETNA